MPRSVAVSTVGMVCWVEQLACSPAEDSRMHVTVHD
jgi:hypothetical protein